MPNYASRRALVMINVQNEYIDGTLRIDYPDVDSSLANLGRAMDAARSASISIVVVQHLLPIGAPAFAEGSRGAELHPVVAGARRDHLIEKSMPSAFSGTDLGAWLAR